ncbi:MAG: hypothetical protein RL653_3516 [Pseudomonadota bacterium]|jgi:hypothetical protein
MERALSERTAALVEAREEVDALRRALAGRGHEEVPAYPAGTTPGAPPLRYVLVDAVHVRVKASLGVLRRVLGRDGAP